MILGKVILSKSETRKKWCVADIFIKIIEFKNDVDFINIYILNQITANYSDAVEKEYRYCVEIEGDPLQVLLPMAFMLLRALLSMEYQIMPPLSKELVDNY